MRDPGAAFVPPTRLGETRPPPPRQIIETWSTGSSPGCDQSGCAGRIEAMPAGERGSRALGERGRAGPFECVSRKARRSNSPDHVFIQVGGLRNGTIGSLGISSQSSLNSEGVLG